MSMTKYKNVPAPVHISTHSKTWISIALLVISGLAFSGCLSRPPLNKETFAFSAPMPNGSSQTHSGRVLGIKPIRIDSPFNGREIIYRTGEFSYQRNEYAEFLGTPAEQLAGLVGGIMATNGYFSAVVRAGSTARPDTVMEINVSQLYGDIQNPESPSAVVALQVVMMNATNGMTDAVVFRGNYSRRIPMKSTAPAALMESWNEAFVEILPEVTADFQAQENLSNKP